MAKHQRCSCCCCVLCVLVVAILASLLLPEPINAIWCFSFHQTLSAYMKETESEVQSAAAYVDLDLSIVPCAIWSISSVRKSVDNVILDFLEWFLLKRTHTDTYHIISYRIVSYRLYCIHIHIFWVLILTIILWPNIGIAYRHLWNRTKTYKTIFFFSSRFDTHINLGNLRRYVISTLAIAIAIAILVFRFFGWSTSYTNIEWKRKVYGSYPLF